MNQNRAKDLAALAVIGILVLAAVGALIFVNVWAFVLGNMYVTGKGPDAGNWNGWAFVASVVDGAIVVVGILSALSRVANRSSTWRKDPSTRPWRLKGHARW